MSIQRVICNYIEEYFKKHNTLESIFKLQKELKCCYKKNLEILDNTDIAALLIKNITNILNWYYGLSIQGKKFNFYTKDSKFICDCYTRLYITPFNIFVEFEEKLNENMFKLDRNIYKYTRQNAYYLDLKSLKIEEVTEIYKIKDIDNINNDGLLILEKDLIMKIIYSKKTDWYGHYLCHEYNIYLNNIEVESISDTDYYNSNYYIAYCKSNKVSDIRIPYKYKMINKKDIEEFIYNNNVENYYDFICQSRKDAN